MLLPLLPLATLLLLLSGCATVPGEADPADPLEPFNRQVHRFNDTIDRSLLQPLAEGYQAALPAPVSRSISNLFSNLDDVTVLANDLLQLKFDQAAQDLTRIVFNSSFGLFGLFDVATAWGLPKHDEDFGQTLGYWGIPSGPYLVLPLLGPSTLRDAGGRVADLATDPRRDIPDSGDQNRLRALNIVDSRANLLRTGELIDQAALDPYLFVRDAYLQRRTNQIYDGEPPADELFDPFRDLGPGQ